MFRLLDTNYPLYLLYCVSPAIAGLSCITVVSPLPRTHNCFVMSDSLYKENRRHSLPDSKLLIGNYLDREGITTSTQKSSRASHQLNDRLQVDHQRILPQLSENLVDSQASESLRQPQLPPAVGKYPRTSNSPLI